jgi:hypothetical protein
MSSEVSRNQQSTTALNEASSFEALAAVGAGAAAAAAPNAATTSAMDIKTERRSNENSTTVNISGAKFDLGACRWTFGVPREMNVETVILLHVFCADSSLDIDDDDDDDDDDNMS